MLLQEAVDTSLTLFYARPLSSRLVAIHGSRSQRREINLLALS